MYFVNISVVFCVGIYAEYSMYGVGRYYLSYLANTSCVFLIFP